MLNGIDPIILFNFFKLTPSLEEKISKIPVVSSIVKKIGLPPIPVYLSERLTGIFIDSESKNIDIETSTETLTDGKDPQVNQKGIASIVNVNMVAKRGSIGLILLSAMCDQILPKVTSKEYSITYLHGAVTIFNGLLHQFSVNQNANDDLMQVTLQISRSSAKTLPAAAIPVVQKTVELVL